MVIQHSKSTECPDCILKMIVTNCEHVFISVKREALENVRRPLYIMTGQISSLALGNKELES